MSILHFLAGALASGPPLVVAGPTGLFNGAARTAQPFSFIIPSGTTGLVLTVCMNDGQTISSVTWQATGGPVQTMVPLTVWSASGSITRIQVFHMLNPSLGTASGAGTFTVNQSSSVVLAVVMRGLSGWAGQAPVENGGGGSNTAAAGTIVLTSTPPNWLGLHDIVGSSSGVGINTPADETQGIDSALGSSVMRVGAARKSGGVGGSITFGPDTFSGTQARWAETVLAFGA